MSQPVIQMINVQKHYQLDGVDVHALRDINLSVDDGEFVTIMGPSGSGKSTLMNIIGCLDLPDSGEFWLAGKDVTTLSQDQLAILRNRTLGFIFQGFNLLARTTALENVATPLIYNGVPRHERKQRAMELLHRVGLGERMHHLPNQLSGGQQQRVAIARALVNHPSLLLADEPTGNLDSVTSHDILDLLEELNRDQGISIILITHEQDIAMRSRRTLTLKDGMIEA